MVSEPLDSLCQHGIAYAHQEQEAGNDNFRQNQRLRSLITATNGRCSVRLKLALTCSSAADTCTATSSGAKSTAFTTCDHAKGRWRDTLR